MSLLKYIKKRLNIFLEEIGRLSAIEFPYPQSKEALQILELRFKGHLSDLNKLDEASDIVVVKQTAENIIGDMVNYLPVLGFILRSTNVRNAFEVYGPTLRLARALLEPGPAAGGKQTRLILSSEWEYAPYVYRELPHLKDFTLIGLPAPESSDPLLVPLFGHELGHLVWGKNRMKSVMGPKIEEKIAKNIRIHWAKCRKVFSDYPEPPPSNIVSYAPLLFYERWGLSFDWALWQAEETFSDFVGLYVFGPSFLYAFAYLLSPNVSPERDPYYPNMKTRVKNLAKAAAIYNVDIDSNYASIFEDAENSPMTEADELRLGVADAALTDIVDNLIDKAKDIVNSSPLKRPSKTEQKKIIKKIQEGIPAEDCQTLPDILNAAWIAYEDPDLWKDNPHLKSNREAILNNIVLKTIEVFEIEKILGKSK